MRMLSRAMRTNLTTHLSRYTEGLERNREQSRVLSMPVRNFQEEFGRADFTSLLLDVSHLRLAKGYSAVKTVWQDIVVRTSVSDFKTNYIAAAGSFPDLEAVPELSPYPDVKFTDEQASYAATKYGQMFGVSMEAKANDALGELGRNVQKFGASSARTIENFVVNTNLAANPTIFDSNSLFDDTNHANDKGSGGYSRANLILGLAAFANQTGRDGEKINIRPRYLLVRPEDLVEALEDVRSSGKLLADQDDAATVFVGGDNVLPTFGLEVIASPYLTAAEAFLVADPREYETFELGFLTWHCSHRQLGRTFE
mgnify:CR=1 FL=1